MSRRNLTFKVFPIFNKNLEPLLVEEFEVFKLLLVGLIFSTKFSQGFAEFLFVKSYVYLRIQITLHQKIVIIWYCMKSRKTQNSFGTEQHWQFSLLLKLSFFFRSLASFPVGKSVKLFKQASTRRRFIVFMEPILLNASKFKFERHLY